MAGWASEPSRRRRIRSGVRMSWTVRRVSAALRLPRGRLVHSFLLVFTLLFPPLLLDACALFKAHPRPPYKVDIDASPRSLHKLLED